MMISAIDKPIPRRTPGYRIRQDTLDHLDPMERAWARRLIARGEWQLIPDEED